MPILRSGFIGPFSEPAVELKLVRLDPVSISPCMLCIDLADLVSVSIPCVGT